MEDKQVSKSEPDIQSLVKLIVDEVTNSQQQMNEPVYKKELTEERIRREQLERRLNELIEENRATKATSEALERETRIKAELQKQGVAKLELAYKAVKDDVQREADGSLVAHGPDGSMPLKEYLKTFLDDNPELLPARNTGGSGALSPKRGSNGNTGIDLDSIRPGMNKEDMARVRQEIARVAGLLNE